MAKKVKFIEDFRGFYNDMSYLRQNRNSHSCEICNIDFHKASSIKQIEN